MIRELDLVVLTRDLKAEGLKAGDVGAAVLVHHNGEAFEVEFASLSGDTLAIVTVIAADLRAVREREIIHAREIA